MFIIWLMIMTYGVTEFRQIDLEQRSDHPNQCQQSSMRSHDNSVMAKCIGKLWRNQSLHVKCVWKLQFEIAAVFPHNDTSNIEVSSYMPICTSSSLKNDGKCEHISIIPKIKLAWQGLVLELKSFVLPGLQVLNQYLSKDLFNWTSVFLSAWYVYLATILPLIPGEFCHLIWTVPANVR